MTNIRVGESFFLTNCVAHKEQWLKICLDRPDVFVNAARNADVGPLQALIDELESTRCSRPFE